VFCVHEQGLWYDMMSKKDDFCFSPETSTEDFHSDIANNLHINGIYK